MTKEQILNCITKAGKPLSIELLEEALVTTVKDRKRLRVLCEELVIEGKLILNRKKRYARPTDLNLYVGQIKKNSRGFGFLLLDSDTADIFISKSRLNGAQDGDTVIVRKLKTPLFSENRADTHDEGEVIRILKRARDSFVGTVIRKNKSDWLKVDDSLVDFDIKLKKVNQPSYRRGDKVVVKIIKWTDNPYKESILGVVDKVLGHENDKGMDILSIIYRNGLETNFSEETLKAVNRLDSSISNAEMDKRIDYRNLDVITIDGVDSKDLDDAVYVKKVKEGYLLSVHIADVGHYVKEDSPIDSDAFRRGTSVYFPDRVLPMLPEKLSNDLCSLHPKTDKLTLTCNMIINKKGDVISHSIEESVVNTSYRMTYDEVNQILLEEDKTIKETYSKILPMLQDMADLQKILYKKRFSGGSLDFELPETKVILNEDGYPIDIVFRERRLAERLIEEFMICANQTVAEHFFWLESPFLYRVHEKPEQEKLELIKNVLMPEGILFKITEDLSSKVFQNLLGEIKDSSLSYPIGMLLLRSMKHAHYSSSSDGHFGLGLKYYTHFTSPIRRYSDLAIHRIIKEHIAFGGLSNKRVRKLSTQVNRYAEQASKMELIAEDAERQAVALKKAQYMKKYVGKAYLARIVSVLGFGFFVQLDNSVEGLVHISTLDGDFYDFYPEKLAIVGRNTNKTFRVGDLVHVVLVNVNLREAKLDFELKEEDDESCSK